MRQSAYRLLALAKNIAKTARSLGFDKPIALPPPVKPEDEMARYLDAVRDSDLRDATQKLFADEHYARSVEEAYKCLNNYVKSKSGLKNLDGAKLMRSVFSPNNPKLKLNRLSSASQNNEQLGYMDIFAGSMTGIRNPRAHEHRIKDSADEALKLLTWADHLMKKSRNATKPRKVKPKP